MDKQELKIFSYSYVDDLIRNVKNQNNLDYYQKVIFPFKESFAKGKTGIYINKTCNLISPASTRKNYDFENSQLLYENIGPLNEVQASDPRLWTYLTHVVFWDYMVKRWPISNVNDDSEVGRILDRYFLRSLNLESLVRNGLSRLWWYAHLTIDINRKNKYELTEILLERADISVGILERSLGANKSIRFAILEFLRDNPDIRMQEDKTRILIRKLNLVGGVKNLPHLYKDNLVDLLKNQISLELN
jgi:hypothetical protein